MAEALDRVLAAIRERAVAVAAGGWPELGGLVDRVLPRPLDPMALLPVATGRAFRGREEPLVRAAAAVVLSDVALRIVDDCADRDDPGALDRVLGLGPALNAATALHACAAREFARLGAGEPHVEALLQVCRGQERDMQRAARTLAEYQEVVLLKTVRAYEYAAAIGARVAGAGDAAIARAGACGAHLGWMAQILDDVEALWCPPRGHAPEDRLTFPALYGRALSGPEAAAVGELCDREPRDVEALRRLLDGLDVRARLVGVALDHRDRALALLGDAPDPEGAAIVGLWLDCLLADAGRLLSA